jgi:hypothetical protein
VCGQVLCEDWQGRGDGSAEEVGCRTVGFDMTRGNTGVKLCERCAKCGEVLYYYRKDVNGYLYCSECSSIEPRNPLK